MKTKPFRKFGALVTLLALSACGAPNAAKDQGNITSTATLVSKPMTLETLKVASWNIANLAQAPGVELRGGYARSQEELNDIKDIISSLEADVIAFQEIGSKPTLRQVLDTDVYNFEFETRCLKNSANCEEDDGKIYTAIAWKNTIDASIFQIDELAVEHTNECGVTRAVRGAVGISFTNNSQKIHIPSLHIKASCKDDKIEPGTEDDCKTQRQQFEILDAWMKDLPNGEDLKPEN